MTKGPSSGQLTRARQLQRKVSSSSSQRPGSGHPRWLHFREPEANARRVQLLEESPLFDARECRNQAKLGFRANKINYVRRCGNRAVLVQPTSTQKTAFALLHGLSGGLRYSQDMPSFGLGQREELKRDRHCPSLTLSLSSPRCASPVHGLCLFFGTEPFTSERFCLTPASLA